MWVFSGNRVRWKGSSEVMELKMVCNISIGDTKRSKTLTREAAREKSRMTESSRSTSV